MSEQVPSKELITAPENPTVEDLIAFYGDSNFRSGVTVRVPYRATRQALEDLQERVSDLLAQLAEKVIGDGSDVPQFFRNEDGDIDFGPVATHEPGTDESWREAYQRTIAGPGGVIAQLEYERSRRIAAEDACTEFVRMQHDIASLLGVDADTDSIDLHGRIYGALSSSQPPAPEYVHAGWLDRDISLRFLDIKPRPAAPGNWVPLYMQRPTPTKGDSQ